MGSFERVEDLDSSVSRQGTLTGFNVHADALANLENENPSRAPSDVVEATIKM